MIEPIVAIDELITKTPGRKVPEVFLDAETRRISGFGQPFSVLSGQVVALAISEDALFAIYEQPRAWWQFWRSEYAVQRFDGERIA